MKQAEIYKVYEVHESQIQSITQALDAIMIAEHILTDDREMMVSPEAVASILSIAHLTISDIVDDIMESAVS